MPPTDPNPKYWWCGGREGAGHVVGMIGEKELQAGGRVKVLDVFEVSVDAPPRVVPALRGRVLSGFGLRCTICGKEFEWYPNVGSLRRLMAHYQEAKRESV